MIEACMQVMEALLEYVEEHGEFPAVVDMSMEQGAMYTAGLMSLLAAVSQGGVGPALVKTSKWLSLLSVNIDPSLDGREFSLRGRLRIVSGVPEWTVD